jgi:hypothetical protein
MTINDVFDSYEPSIAIIGKTNGIESARAAIVFLVADLIEFFNTGETMSDVQIATTIDLIIEEYPYFKMDDLKLCFKNAMKQKYGRVYNRLDGAMIMGWLQQYNKDRCMVADNISYNEHKSCLAEEKRCNDGIFYEDYKAELQRRADSGDKEAIKALEMSNNIASFLRSHKRRK